MSRGPARAAWTMLALAAGCWVASVPLMVGGVPFQQDPAVRVDLWLTPLLVFGLFTPVGAVIVANRPGHAIGWIYSGVGLLAATGMLAQQYATYAYFNRSGVLPAALLAAWYQAWWVWPTSIPAFVFAPLLFPTGRLPSRGWRAVMAIATVLAIA